MTALFYLITQNTKKPIKMGFFVFLNMTILSVYSYPFFTDLLKTVRISGDFPANSFFLFDVTTILLPNTFRAATSPIFTGSGILMLFIVFMHSKILSFGIGRSVFRKISKFRAHNAHEYAFSEEAECTQANGKRK